MLPVSAKGPIIKMVIDSSRGGSCSGKQNFWYFWHRVSYAKSGEGWEGVGLKEESRGILFGGLGRVWQGVG